MKIYSKVVWHWQPDGSLVEVPEECESFDYDGQVAQCGGIRIGGEGDNVRSTADPVSNLWSGKGKFPPQPDYIGAANAQSLGSIGTALANNLMSHPNISTPLGSQTWNQTGSSKINIPGLGGIDIPQYSQTVSLSPEQQKLYDQQTKLSGGLLGQASQNLSQPQDLNSVQAINDKAYGALTSRLDPQWKQAESMNDTQLANQGIMRGSEAYDNAKREFGQQKNDAYQQANLAAIQTMPQTFQLASATRDQPLNEMNALHQGSQVNMPQFQPSQYPGQATGPSTLDATKAGSAWQQNIYNAQQAQRNSTMNGLAGLGSAAMYMFS